MNTQDWREGPVIRLGADKNHAVPGSLGGRNICTVWPRLSSQINFSSHFRCCIAWLMVHILGDGCLVCPAWLREDRTSDPVILPKKPKECEIDDRQWKSRQYPKALWIKTVANCCGPVCSTAVEFLSLTFYLGHL